MYDIIRRQFTDKQRTALLAELRGMPQSEIARHLGSNRNPLPSAPEEHHGTLSARNRDLLRLVDLTRDQEIDVVETL